MNDWNSQRVDQLVKDNFELSQIIATLLQRTDELLDSRPWRLGLIVARIERPFRKLILRDRRRFRHLTRSYFHDVAEKAAAFRTSWQPATGAYDDVPSWNVVTSVRETLESLWTAIGVRQGDQR